MGALNNKNLKAPVQILLVVAHHLDVLECLLFSERAAQGALVSSLCLAKKQMFYSLVDYVLTTWME